MTDTRTGAHWPIDQTAGLLTAACLLTVLYSVGLVALRNLIGFRDAEEHADHADRHHRGELGDDVEAS